MFRHGQRFVAHAQALHASQHEIKLLRSDVFVQSVRALGRQPPQPRAEILAPGALQKIRIGDFHQVGRPPEEVLRLDEMVTLNRFHELAGECLAAVKTNQFAHCSQAVATEGGVFADLHRGREPLRNRCPLARLWCFSSCYTRRRIFRWNRNRQIRKEKQSARSAVTNAPRP